MSLIRQRNQAARISFTLLQPKFPLRKPRREQGDPFANQYWRASQIEFIHQIFLQELPRQFPTAHQKLWCSTPPCKSTHHHRSQNYAALLQGFVAKLLCESCRIGIGQRLHGEGLESW